MRLIKNSPKLAIGATVAAVSFSEASGFGVVGASEYRGTPIFAPKGISYRPSEGDNLLILPVDGTDTCIGTLCSPSGLAPGELRLASAGGASLVLNNSGDIVLNGVTITKSGQILSPGEGDS